MFKSKFLPLSSLVDLSWSLRHSLDAGINIRKAFQQLATKGPVRARKVCHRIYLVLKKGNSLETALKNEECFPPLFKSLVIVGEESGHLVEIFASLEKYYQLQQQSRRQFYSQIILPVGQAILAVLIIALVIWVLGFLGSTRGNPNSGLFGLSGGWGAMIFLGLVAGVVLGVYVICVLVGRLSTGRIAIGKMLMKTPVLGGYLEAAALSRFTLALQLTLDSGISVIRSVRLSLLATGNPVFASQGGKTKKLLQSGEDLSLALGATKVFPDSFLTIISMAETSGRIPEVMEHQHEQYKETVTQRLKRLTQLASWGVWLLYAIFMVIMIFYISSFYFVALGI